VVGVDISIFLFVLYYTDSYGREIYFNFLYVYMFSLYNNNNNKKL
jgi:hypothetical protein